MYKNITPDYYGYRDDDDGVLMEKEATREVGSDDGDRYFTTRMLILCMQLLGSLLERIN